MRIKIKLLIFVAFILSNLSVFPQKKTSDANIVGHVVCCGEHIPFATIRLKGTTVGTTTDETGHYQLINLPPGEHIVLIEALGYKTKEIKTQIKESKTKEIKVELEKDVLGLSEVVVSSNRFAKSRLEASTIVNTLSSDFLETTNSVTISEGLNFCPGLRMENNCQNCGFTQLRINGMEGPYSQILINSRPIFSGLAGVYGLELIPSNIVEKIEIIRGGGSALYGSNAIAGSVNLILKEPKTNSYEIETMGALTGIGMKNNVSPAEDYSLKFNTSVISSDSKTGMTLYGFYRDKNPFDANNDGFSEIAKSNNTSIGARVFHRFSIKNKITLDIFNIREERRGGNAFNNLNHQADIAEAVDHNMLNASINFEQYLREKDMFSVYISGLGLDRDSYYGAEKSLKDYGRSKSNNYLAGMQYNAFFGRSNLVAGVENNYEILKDKKLGYPSYSAQNDSLITEHMPPSLIVDQRSNIIGLFAQYEIDFDKLQLSAGVRYDNYLIEDLKDEGEDIQGNVFSPRITFKYKILSDFQARFSYSQGYRAPQIFDEDLHIESSGSRQITHENSGDLDQETSHSLMASLDYNKQIGNAYFNFLVEGFYTILDNAFTNEFTEDSLDPEHIIYVRRNAENGAVVKGINAELSAVPADDLSIKGGYTIQESKYEDPQEFDEKKFFRTPESYGFLTIDWQPFEKAGAASTFNYTGKMLVPYFGNSLNNPENGELRTSKSFFDLGLKLYYNIKINGATLQFAGGVKNIFNSYQDDFDSGIDRDPAYIYGPMQPRTVYLSINLGNLIR